MGAAILSIDIGNTKTRAGLIDIESLSCTERASCATGDIPKTLGDLAATLRRLEPGNRAMPVRICSVVPSVCEQVESIIGGLDGLEKPKWIGYADNLPISIAYDNPEKLGADRIADLLYAHAAKQDGNAAVIDAGTAITFDCLNARNEFAGGAIFPGPSLQLSSLKAETAQLPVISELSSPPPLPATSTGMCMQSGVWYGIAGALEKMLAAYAKQFGSIAVYACGGAWQSIAPLVSFDYTYEESLTLIGAALYE